jgi:hypothetical protein
MFDISPHALHITAWIGNTIFIRVLNCTMRDQWHSNYEYHQSLSFLPLYFDEDYNSAHNMEIF